MTPLAERIRQLTFGDRPAEGLCVKCKTSSILYRVNFRDDVSWKEAQISELCQVCQDFEFYEGEEENCPDDGEEDVDEAYGEDKYYEPPDERAF